jgi:hypothetical protein
MLTSLSQFQAQGWEKWLSRITFTRGTNSLKSGFDRRLFVPLSHSTFKLKLRICLYSDKAIAVLGPRQGKFAGIGKVRTYAVSQSKT